MKKIATIKGNKLPMNEKGSEDLVIHKMGNVVYLSYKKGGDLCRGTWQEVGNWIDKFIN